jgi:hypothetical protein
MSRHKAGGLKQEAETDPVTAAERDDLIGGKSFVTVYGKLTYHDVFSVQHWSYFCMWFTAGPPRLYTSGGCTKYNKIDSN